MAQGEYMRLFTSLFFVTLILGSATTHAMISKISNKILNRNAKIAIIGAGPAGLSSAAWLTQNGFKQVTLYEKSTHAFGKVRSQKIGPSLVELGPIQVGIGHIHTHYWLNKLGLKTFEPHNAFILRKGEHEHSHRILTSAQEYIPYGQRTEIMKEACRLNNIINEFNELYPELKDIPEGSVYCLSFLEFAKKYDLPHFLKMYGIYTSAYGYGIVSEIPAFTVLRTFGASFGLVAWLYAGMNLKMIKEGFSGLMQALVDHHELGDKIKYGQNITSITRSPGAEIIIKSNNEELSYDYLIVACPIDKVFNAYSFVSKQESEAYENLYYSPYHVFVADIPDLPRGGFVLPEKFNRHGTLQMLSKNSEKGDHVILYVPQASSVKAKDIIEKRVQLPQLAESINAARRDLEELGFHLGKVYDGAEWNQYNPHFLNPEFYGHGDSMQGQNKTFYVGTMWAEIDYVDKALGHANKITSRFFDGVYDQPEQSLSNISRWHFGAEDAYSDEQNNQSPSQWGLTFQDLFGE